MNNKIVLQLNSWHYWIFIEVLHFLWILNGFFHSLWNSPTFLLYHFTSTFAHIAASSFSRELLCFITSKRYTKDEHRFEPTWIDSTKCSNTSCMLMLMGFSLTVMCFLLFFVLFFLSPVFRILSLWLSFLLSHTQFSLISCGSKDYLSLRKSHHKSSSHKGEWVRNRWQRLVDANSTTMTMTTHTHRIERIVKSF